MPGAHRDQDSRFCGGKTTVTNQTTIYVNNQLWAVEGDEVADHGGGGSLKSVMGGSSVLIENKPIIVAVGDTTLNNDNQGHSPGQADPQGRSSNVFAYESGAGGTVS